MKIIVIVPTLNEETNISHLTSVVDEGLTSFFPNIEKEIVNVDSNSTDKTTDKFLATKTTTIKKSLVCPDNKRGKGYGIKLGIEYGLKNKGAFFLTLDADVISITEHWVNKFLSPIIKNNADLVIPIYKRNRYEGNLTNHLLSPSIYAYFNLDIPQPIAGDFSFNKDVAADVLSEMKYLSDFKYGIDSLITAYAVINKKRIRQIKLTQKIHNPSFPKIIPIFLGETTTLFTQINKNREKILSLILKSKNKLTPLANNNIIDSKYVLRPETFKLEKTIRRALNISKHPIREFTKKDMLSFNTSIKHVDIEIWDIILSGYLALILEKDFKFSEIRKITKSLLYFYLLRVANYFQSIRNVQNKVKAIDQSLKDQKVLLRTSLLKRLRFI